MDDVTTISKSFSRSTLIGVLVFAFAVPAWAARASFDRIVVFGTSLSDSGNYFALSGGNNTPPAYLEDDLLVPDAAYARGGHHLSNGATWIEQLARPLGLAGSVRPAFRGSSGASNYAVDGARAYDDGINVNFSEQVGRFLQDAAGVAPASALYVVEMGSNDVRDALVSYVSGDDGGAIVQAALGSIALRLQALYAAGARRFLIWNVPDISKTPAVHMLDDMLYARGAINQGDIIHLAATVTQGFNANIALIIGQLEALPGTDVKPFDAFDDLDRIVADPAAFGLTDVTDPCLTPDVPPFQCQRPAEYLFWDGTHPTAAGHAITAEQAAIVLGL